MNNNVLYLTSPKLLLGLFYLTKLRYYYTLISLKDMVSFLVLNLKMEDMPMCITLPKFDLERMINKSVTLVFASHARTYQVKEIGRFLRRAFQLKNLKLDLGERNAITYLHSSEIGQLTANILFSGLVESTLIDRFEVKDETSQKQEQE